jgi:ubiquinone/menaquinone biosynthesis C-methylase UbiE
MSLKELFRVLAKDGRLFIVVRSTKDPENKYSHAKYHPNTCLTEYFFTDEKGFVHKDRLVSRYFHTQKTIKDHLKKAGFKINRVKQYNEQLYIDFERKKLSTTKANVIEVIAQKPI